MPNKNNSASTDFLWDVILPSFGIGSEHLKNRHGPCPGCGGKDRFRFDDKDGRGTWFCNGGGNPTSGDGYALIAHVCGWDNKRAYHEVQSWFEGGAAASTSNITPRETRAQPVPKRDTAPYGLKLWNEATGRAEFHPYAKAKAITWEAGAKRHTSVSGSVVGNNSDCLLIPFRDLETGSVIAVQAINTEGKKQTFGSTRGHAFFCGNTLDKSIRWFVVEGWADAISMVFHEYRGNACAFAAGGTGAMNLVAEKVAKIYRPDLLIQSEDAL